MNLAGFCAWRHEPESERHRRDLRLLALIRNSYAGSHSVYGARRGFGDLREVEETCGLHRVDAHHAHAQNQGCAWF